MSVLKPRVARLAALALVALPLLSACGGDTATTTPVVAPPTNTVAPAAAPSNTAAAAAVTNTPAAVAAGSTDTAIPAMTVMPTAPATVISGGEGCAANAPKVTWYVGLGAGGDADVIPKETAWVDNFNKSQTDACLVLQIVHNPESYDTLKAELAAGTGPDIVGPVGKQGRASFQGAWLDITALAKKANFDLTQYDPSLLDFLKDNDVQVGIPFALYPGVIYYNKALFDEAKLPYPPHKVGEKYQGKDWNLDTLTELAKKLTVDKSGNAATASGFDSKNVTQFGMWMGFTDARRMISWVGAGLPYDPADQTTAKIPDTWRANWKWLYDGVWKSYFMPNNDYINSDLFGKGNPFSSGNTAMTWSLTWYTCCFDMKKLNWDIAVVPQINGKTTAGLDGDTFAILKQSKNPDAAFKVLSKMATDKDLSLIYGGIPGKTADRTDFFSRMDQNSAPNKVDWSVAQEMLKYPDIPGHESWTPNLIKANDLFNKFYTYMISTPGLDMDKEVDKLQSQLSALFKEPGAISTPTTP